MTIERDAARYRFLRDSKRLGHWRVQQWEIEDGAWNPDRGKGEFRTLEGSALDAAIDEAMTTQNTEPAGPHDR